MAGTLSVTNIQGLATSATPTVVEVSSGHSIKGLGFNFGSDEIIILLQL